ncbi:MAG TPA: thiol reductase thioredoxin [Thermoanaerobaculia bacterium]|jgi:tetratricopeptide (TPR) repeat protein|nr:thiol reductase thioredoxin [Thermoanaerobaculia bacterium]
MRAYVFTDKSLARHAGQFVWLSIDTEKAGNAPFLTKYPVQAWPSFFVLDPAKEKVAVRWVGGATVAQVSKILEDGKAAVRGKEKGLDQTLARADALYGEGKNAEAIREYRDALSRAPAGWPQYGRAVESLLFALQNVRDHKGCAETARDAYPRLSRTSSAANVAATGLDCALGMKADDPARPALVAALAENSRQVLASPRPDIAADDISAVYDTLASEREDAKDEAGQKKYFSERAAFLEKAAAEAKNPEARAVFDSHRLSTYIALGEPERAIPMLEASERDLPDDYNPPARLAAAYKAMKRYDDALAASDRALSKAYGPRKVGILQTRADIQAAKGDTAAARRTIEETLQYAQDLPPGQRSERTIASLRKKLEGMP